MVKKTIKYKDFNDEEREETFYFHLSKANLIAMEAEHRGGLRTYLERIAAEQDTKKIWDYLSEIVLMSYGKRSDDGARHIKSAQLREEFESSEAFSELLMSLLSDPAGAAEFINGLIPNDLRAQVGQIVPPGPRPAVATQQGDTWNVFEKESAHARGEAEILEREKHVPTESRMHPPEGALGGQPAAEVLTEVQLREMDPAELQQGLIAGRFKLPQ